MDHPHVFWMDSSIRFKRTGSLTHIKPQYRKTHGIVGMLKVGHSILSATHPKLYEYFPSNATKLKDTGTSYVTEACHAEIHLVAHLS